MMNTRICHHHHHPRISSRRKSSTKLQGRHCETAVNDRRRSSSEGRTQKHARGNVKRANGRVTTGTSALLRCIQLPPSTMQRRRLSPVSVVNRHSVKSLTWNWPLCKYMVEYSFKFLLAIRS